MANILTQAGSSYAPASLLSGAGAVRNFFGSPDPSTVATLATGDLWWSTMTQVTTGSFVLGVTKPDNTNVGSTSRTGLTPTNTSSWAPTAGATYNNLNFVGPSIVANVSNVTFNNCYFGCGTNTTGLAQVNLFNAGTWNWTFTNCTFYPDVTNPVELDNIGGHDFIMTRCDLAGGTDNVGVFNTHNSGASANAQVLGCYLHGLAFCNNDPDHLNDSSHPGWSHNDGVQVQGNSGTTLVGNNIQTYIDPSKSTGYGTSPNQYAPLTYLTYGAGITISPNVSAVTGLTIQQNWFNGGACSFQWNSAQYSGGSNTVGDFSNNRFGLDQHDYGSLGKFQIRYNQGFIWTGLGTNYFDPADATVIAAGVGGNFFSEGKTTGIRINGID